MSDRPVRLLVVDDEEAMRFFLSRSLSRRGYAVDLAADGQEALRLFTERAPDLVLLDLRMPGLDGMEVLARVRAGAGAGAAPGPAAAGDGAAQGAPVIMMSAHADVRAAVEALKSGADDFLSKPFEIEEAVAVIDRALAARRLARENEELRRRLYASGSFGALVGRSAAMQRLYEMIARVADSSSTVLLLGESGTGKELVAREVHGRSARAARPLLALNCGALPADIVESELFGYLPGAFTGADQRRIGLVEAAEGGTLFLDEIADLPLLLQPKLLRLLQEREYLPLGGREPRRADVRLIAATNADLAARAREGRFREDLFFRLNVVPITVPPLRERLDDLPLLAAHFLARHGPQRPGRRFVFAPGALEALAGRAWPGNVREMENAVERAVVLSTGDALTAQDILPEGAAPGPARPAGGVDMMALPLREAVRQFERDHLERLLRASGGNISRAAEVAGISRPHLHRRIRDLGIDSTTIRRGEPE